MRLQGTITQVEPDKIVVQLPQGKKITVRRNDVERWEKNPTTPWHIIAILGFDDSSAKQRDILGLTVTVSTDCAGILRVADIGAL